MLGIMIGIVIWQCVDTTKFHHRLGPNNMLGIAHLNRVTIANNSVRGLGHHLVTILKMAEIGTHIGSTHSSNLQRFVCLVGIVAWLRKLVCLL